MQKVFAIIAPLLALIHAQAAALAAQDSTWTIALHPSDFVVGPALKQLRTRHAWVADFNDQSGAFQVALRKTAVAIPAPHCRMDYLILEIPFYYPETPKQASTSERRAIYDGLIALQTSGKGSLTTRVEAPGPLARIGPSGIELAACNVYFAWPLSLQAPAP
jgi:hypothetical protein